MHAVLQLYMDYCTLAHIDSHYQTIHFAHSKNIYNTKQYTIVNYTNINELMYDYVCIMYE